MAATEDDIIRDEQERGNLLRTIKDVESAIADSTPGTRRILENARENAIKRVATLDKKIEEAKADHAAEARAQAAAAAAMAAKEKALSDGERETFGSFLKEAFFTKKDFNKLEAFYAHSWNRLSEEGKDEMSHRVWEGVRHGEYRFTDLPKDVRDKGEDRLYRKLTTPLKTYDKLEQIPDADRSDFIRAYKSGNHEEAGRILNRDSLHAAVANGTFTAASHTTADVEANNVDDKNVVQSDPIKPAAATRSGSSSAIGKVDVDALGLADVKFADASTALSPANIPDATGNRAAVRS